MKILFVNLSSLKFTVASPDHTPLGGSESALCYFARALAQLGHNVSLTANLPENAGSLIENIHHYPLTAITDPAFFTSQNFDAIIICNAPVAASLLKAASPQSRIIFWAHALPDQPAMQCLSQNDVKQAIDETVFVSAWQRGEVERVFGSFANAHVIGNGIAPAFENMFSSPAAILAVKQNRAAYTTTPYRGLSVLLRAMQNLDRPTKLDVFSSMKTYQAGDEDYAPLFAEAAQNPAITLHGAVTQKTLAQSLRAPAFLFYPSIYPETFCITAAEAMAAGMKIVTTNLGALPDTCMGFAKLVPITSQDGDILARDFRAAMQQEIDAFASHPQNFAEQSYAQIQQVNKSTNWAVRVLAWNMILVRI